MEVCVWGRSSSKVCPKVGLGSRKIRARTSVPREAQRQTSAEASRPPRNLALQSTVNHQFSPVHLTLHPSSSPILLPSRPIRPIDRQYADIMADETPKSAAPISKTTRPMSEGLLNEKVSLFVPGMVWRGRFIYLDVSNPRESRSIGMLHRSPTAWRNPSCRIPLGRLSDIPTRYYRCEKQFANPIPCL